MSSRKRQREEISEDSPEFKKHKTNIINSKLFTSHHNNHQFQQIFQTIDSSKLLTKLSIPQDISKEIAEYSTGDVKYCANMKCKQSICTLDEDEDDDILDGSRDKERGYAHCNKKNNYWCSDCCDQVKSCEGDNDCQIKIHSSEWTKCDYNFNRACKQYIKTCNNIHNDECRHQYCGVCDRYGCDYCIFEMHFCELCETSICYQCCKFVCKGMVLICNDCYDDEIIECENCGIQCELLAEGNNLIYSKDIRDKYNNDVCMKRCRGKDCANYICYNCIDNKEKKPYCEEHEHLYFFHEITNV